MSEDLNDLLDETIDDLADMPESKPFVDGAHRVLLTIKPGLDEKKKLKPGVYVVECKYIALLEAADPNVEEDKLSKEGDKFASWIYTQKKDGSKNEFGQGQLKTIIKPIAAALGFNKVSEVLIATEDGIECEIITKVRKSRDSQYSDTMNITKLEIAA